MKKRWTAWALTLAMLAGALPGTALAAEDGGALPEPAARQVAALGEEPAANTWYEAQWKDFRNSDDNLGVTDAETPRTAEEAALRWKSAESLNDGWDGVSPLLMVDGDLVCTAGTAIYRIDSAAGAVKAQGVMTASNGAWGNAPLAYGEGKIFVPLLDGRVQAFDAGDLASLWVSEPLGGQCTTALIYRDGYVYGSTGNSAPAKFFCLAAEDEDPAAEDEIKSAAWTAYEEDFPAGSYWATPIVVGDAVIYGTDANGGTAALFSRDRSTGKLLDMVELENMGSVRSSLVRSGDRLYFTTSGGWLCSVELDAKTGELSGLDCVQHENVGYVTSSPVIYDGVVYYGAQGCLVAADAVTLAELRRAAFPDTGAGVQASPLLTTAYAEDGAVYLYVTQNTTPGAMYVVRDDGETLTCSALYTPEESNWCAASAICDGEGTIYYHNDAGYLYALERTGAPQRRCHVTFAVEPAEAEVSVTGAAAERDGTFLLGSGTYAYTVRCEGYVPASGTLTITEAELDTDRTVTVTLDAEQGGSGSTASKIRVTVQVKTHDQADCGGGYTYRGNKKAYTTLAERQLSVPKGTTAYGALSAALDAAGVDYSAREGYVTEIDGLAEFDHSSRSGWMYMVDGILPEVGADRYRLEDGCEVVWFYTDDYTEEQGEEKESGGSSAKPAETGAATAAFTDVPADLWCHDAVMTAVERGWFLGTGQDTFRPDDPMTRGMLVTVLYRMAGSPAAKTAGAFADVAADRCCAGAVAWAAEQEIVTGYGDGTFRPDMPMTRQQMAAVLARYAEREGLDTGTRTELSGFADGAAVGGWARPAMEWAVAEGIFRGGADGALYPDGTLTRAQSAVLLTRLGEKLD